MDVLLLCQRITEGYNLDQWRMMKCSQLCYNSVSPCSFLTMDQLTVPEYIHIGCIIVMAEQLSQRVLKATELWKHGVICTVRCTYVTMTAGTINVLYV